MDRRDFRQAAHARPQRRLVAASGVAMAVLLVGGAERQGAAHASGIAPALAPPPSHLAAAGAGARAVRAEASAGQRPPIRLILPAPTPAVATGEGSLPRRDEHPPLAIAALEDNWPLVDPLPDSAHIAMDPPALALLETGGPDIATVRTAFVDAAHIPQISEVDRAAYIAQVGDAAGQARLAVRLDGEVLGAVAFQVSDGAVSVHLGEVLDLFEARFDAQRFADLRGSAAAAEFVSLEQLRGAGIAIAYSAAYDELTLEPDIG